MTDSSAQGTKNIHTEIIEKLGNISIDDVSYEFEGKVYGKENKILAILLYEGYCFLSDQPSNYEEGKEIACALVNANDLFMWGCADCEPISTAELLDFYKATKTPYGTDKWLCKKRNIKPQYAIQKMIKEAGYWDSEFESLPENTFSHGK